MAQAINPIGRKNLQFRRQTTRYGNKGTFSSNQGFLSVARCINTGKFVSRKHLNVSTVDKIRNIIKGM